MLPVSGAWQLIASGAITGDQPGHLGDRRVLEVGQPRDVGQEQVPQAPVAGLGLELLDDRRELVLGRSSRAAPPATPRRPSRRAARPRRGRPACGRCSPAPRHWVRSPPPHLRTASRPAREGSDARRRGRRGAARTCGAVRGCTGASAALDCPIVTHFRIAEAARLLGVSDDTVRRWTDGDALPVPPTRAAARSSPGRTSPRSPARRPTPPPTPRASGARRATASSASSPRSPATRSCRRSRCSAGRTAWCR